MGKENGGRRSNASLFILGEQTFAPIPRTRSLCWMPAAAFPVDMTKGGCIGRSPGMWSL